MVIAETRMAVFEDLPCTSTQRWWKLPGMQQQDTSRRLGAGVGWRALGVVAVMIAAAACHGAADGSAPPAADKRTQAEIAAQDNADGERLLRAGKYAEAAVKFEAACARQPVVAYCISDCDALMRGGELERALRVCRNARNYDTTPAQRGQIEQLITDIVQAGKAKGLDLCDGCVSGAPAS